MFIKKIIKKRIISVGDPFRAVIVLYLLGATTYVVMYFFLSNVWLGSLSTSRLASSLSYLLFEIVEKLSFGEAEANFLTNPFVFYELFIKIIFHCSYHNLSSSIPKLLLIYKLGKVLFFWLYKFLFIYLFRLGNKPLTIRNHPLWTKRNLIDQVLSQWDCGPSQTQLEILLAFFFLKFF